MPVEERLERRIDRRGPDECWPWLGRVIHGKGYGAITVKGKQRRTHRLIYEMYVGPIPDGLHIDHLCRNRVCCNPAHMEPVTLAENVLRGEGLSALNARKTHCKRGHPLDAEHMSIRLSRKRRPQRVCLPCERAWKRAKYWRDKAAAA